MRKLAVMVICPFLAVVWSGCSAQAPSSEASTPPAAPESAPPIGKLSKAAQAKLERKQALKLKTMVKREPGVEPGGK